jgi:peptide/nickel transport system permease protein
MARILAFKLFEAATMLLVISFLTFAMTLALPGGVVNVILPANQMTPENIARVEQELGLDRPLPVQYASWIGGILKGNFGNSYISGRSVNSLLMEKAQVTFTVALGGLLLGSLLGIGLGTISALRTRSKIDATTNVIASTVIAIPPFYVALVLAVVFTVWLDVLPTGQYVTFQRDPVEWARHLVLPWVATAIPTAAILSRQTRSAALGVLQAPYVHAARANGLEETTIVKSHVLKNSMLPVITELGFRAAVILSSAIVVENVFGLPGLGQFLINAVQLRDLPIVQACVLVTAAAVILVNMVVDLSYSWLNPKVRVE